MAVPVVPATVFKLRGLKIEFCPGSTMFNHCIQNGQEFAHTSDQGHLWALTGGSQSVVKSANSRIMSACYQGSHVKTGPYRGAPAPDAAVAFKLTAVPVKRGDSHQGRDLFTVKLSELWQFGNQRTAYGWADGGSTLKQVFIFFPDRALADRLVQILIGAPQFRFEP